MDNGATVTRYGWTYDEAHPDWPMLCPDPSGQWVRRDDVIAAIRDYDPVDSHRTTSQFGVVYKDALTIRSEILELVRSSKSEGAES